MSADAARIVADMLWNRDRLAAVRSALDEGLANGTLTGTALGHVMEEEYWAVLGLDIATDAVVGLGIDPDNLPEEYLE